MDMDQPGIVRQDTGRRKLLALTPCPPARAAQPGRAGGQGVRAYFVAIRTFEFLGVE